MLPKITELGKLAADPEIRFQPSGEATVKFPIVFNKNRKTDAGGWSTESTLYVWGKAYGQMAENIANSLSKGDSVLISGELSQQEYSGSDGQKRTYLQLYVYSIGHDLKWISVHPERSERSKTRETEDLFATSKDPF